MEDEYRTIKMKKIINFLDKLGYFDLQNNEEAFNNWIASISYEQFKNLISHFNIMLRGERSKQKGFYDYYMFVDSGASEFDLVSPSNEVQGEVLKYLFESMKKTDSNKNRSMIIYYGLLRLHLFEDGNGRTSRLLFDLLNGVDELFLMENIDWYIHDENNTRIIKENFEEIRNIPRVYHLNYAIGFENFDRFIKNMEQRGMEVDEYIKTRAPILTYYNREYDEKILSADIEKQLGTDKADILIKILMDNNERTFSVSGLTSLYVSLVNGTFDEVKTRNDELNNNSQFDFGNRLIFDLYSDFFQKWTKEDCELAIDVGRELQKQTYECLVDFIINPEQYVENGVPIIEYLTPNKKTTNKESQKNI